jgi:hypothetical protein
MILIFLVLSPLIIITSLSILIPILFWIYRVRDIENIYHVFAFCLIGGFLHEIMHFFFRTTYTSILITSIYHFFESQCFLYVFSSWIVLNKNFKKLLHILFFIITSIEFIYILNTGNYNIFWIYVLPIIILVILGFKVLTSQNNRITISQKLIVIPLVVYFIYYSILDILMALLFNKQTQPLFINLYYVIHVINLLSYISFSLAFLWAPKKEKYL